MNLLQSFGHQREKAQSLRWQGTFMDYLQLVQMSPAVAQTAHARVWQMIKSAGFDDQDGVRSYRFFTSKIFGIDTHIQHLVESYIIPAAHGLDVRRRILLLVGPVGSGKSTIATLLKRGLEEFSHTEQGALYCLVGCPMHEEPLHLIPPDMRPNIQAELGVRIEGNLCPYCQQRLQTEFDGSIIDFPVERVLINETSRVGIGTFQPSDPGNQDIAELTGSVDLAAITQYGAESDPRAYRFDGELNIANRGVLEMQEILKCDERFLWHLLSLTQEGNFKASRFALISADEVVIAHCNTDEYRSFVSGKRNEALVSRMLVVAVPYTLQQTGEEKVYQQLVAGLHLPCTHIAPHTLPTAAYFSLLTRQAPGVQADGLKGIDPRFVINRLCAALIKESCVGPLQVLQSLQKGLDSNLSDADKEKERWLELLYQARHQYIHYARCDILSAVRECRTYITNSWLTRYLRSAVLYCSASYTGVHDQNTLPDEIFMRQIEELLGIGESDKRIFRAELADGLHGRDPIALSPDEVHELNSGELGDAIAEHYFTIAVPRLSWHIQFTMRPLPDTDATLVTDIRRTLLERYGYCQVCAQQTLEYVTGPQGAGI